MSKQQLTPLQVESAIQETNSAETATQTASKPRKSAKRKKPNKSRKRQHHPNQEHEATRIDFYIEQVKTAQPYKLVTRKN